MHYWLFKTEPEVFSIEDLKAAPKQTTCWEGVRNYQARNMLRDDMQVGDKVLIYHSGGKEPAAVGTGTIVRGGYPDHFAWDPKSHYYDEGCTAEEPRWYMVDLQWEQTFAKPLTLAELRGEAALSGMELLRKGSRLSVQPVKPAEFTAILKLAGVGRKTSSKRT